MPATLSSHARLVELNLSANRLSGPFPPELCGLACLVSLQLSHNDLEGFLPVEVKRHTERLISSSLAVGVQQESHTQQIPRPAHHPTQDVELFRKRTHTFCSWQESDVFERENGAWKTKCDVLTTCVAREPSNLVLPLPLTPSLRVTRSQRLLHLVITTKFYRTDLVQSPSPCWGFSLQC